MQKQVDAEVGRTPLSRDRILRAAVTLADKDGLESLSMRKLAQQFGVVPMALYKHVANKDDLVDGMVDVVFGEIDHPPSGTDWKTAMRQRALSARQVLSRHRWAIGLTESRMKPGPTNLRHHDSVIRCLTEGGFSIEMAIHAYSALDSYIYGFALQEQQLPFENPGEVDEVAQTMLSQFPSDDYPYLAQTIAEVINKSEWQYADEFEFGLDLILDGLERVLVR
ncbi:MAG: TetR family transcriptional regulator [Actinobacteria bacterium]|nr:TetR family transcriptional regulator [Actinomycetota bacterium]